MTLDEAMARIKELEQENEELKRPAQKWRDAFPCGFEILGWYPQHYEFGSFMACIRKRLFGEVDRVKRHRGGGASDTTIASYPRKLIELTDEEYAYYCVFAKKLFMLVRETIDEWEAKQ